MAKKDVMVTPIPRKGGVLHLVACSYPVWGLAAATLHNCTLETWNILPPPNQRRLFLATMGVCLYPTQCCWSNELTLHTTHYYTLILTEPFTFKLDIAPFTCTQHIHNNTYSKHYITPSSSANSLIISDLGRHHISQIKYWVLWLGKISSNHTISSSH